MAGIIIIIALWTYPILGYLLVKSTRGNKNQRNKLFIGVITLTLISIFGLITKMSTIFSSIDWVLISTPFLFICSSLWITQEQSSRFIKVGGIVFMVFIFGLGYFSSTVGILGVGFIVNEIETDSEKKISDNLIYKEAYLGNAISDYRGKRFEIHRRIGWLPIIERQVASKDVLDRSVYLDSVQVDYNRLTEEVYLRTKQSERNKKRNRTQLWMDTIRLSKK